MTTFKFRVGTSEDKTKVFEFLKNNFWKEEPIFKSSGVELTEDIHERVLKTLDLGTSTIAEDALGNLAGIRLAIPKTLEMEKRIHKRPQTMVEKIRRDLKEGANVFEKFNTDKYMHNRALAVDKKYRRLGLGRKLYEENMKLAKALGYSVYVCECTSAFSAKICDSLDFENIFQVVYSEYRDSKGDLVLSPLPEAPHLKIVVYVKVL